MSGRGVRSHQP